MRTKAATIRTMRRMAQHRTREWENRWLGLPIQQYPNDLVVYQEIMWDVRPDLVIETGTFRGGLAFYLAMLLQWMNRSGRVITIDINPCGWRETVKSIRGAARLRERIRFLAGNSVSKEVTSAVAAALRPDDRVLVLLDSYHGRDHVRQEMETYSQFVTVGSYLIVNDTHFDTVLGYGPGPLAAVRHFLRSHREFVVDRSRNRFLVTSNPDSFLKRVR
jgi:cephalosporin hydroxylase